MRYKEWDVVEIKCCMSGHGFKIGDRVTIKEVIDDDHYLAFNNLKANWYITDEELK